MANKAKFKTGDLVVLLSGGPVMTIQDISDYTHTVGTSWFSGRKLEQGFFQPETLRRATEDDK